MNRRRIGPWVVAALLGGGIGAHAVASAPSSSADPIVPEVNVTAATLWEGDAGFVVLPVSVELSAPTTVTTSVRYAVQAGSASAGSDYAAKSGRVTFLAGQTSKRVSIKVFADTVNESDEVFTVALSTPVGVTIASGIGEVTILDDDGPGSTSALEATIGDATIVEGDAGKHELRLLVSLSSPAPSTVKVQVTLDCSSATIGEDFMSSQQRTITFSASQRSKTVTFTIVADFESEELQSIVSSLRVMSGPAILGQDEGEVFIADDDVGGPGGDPPVGSIERVSVPTGGGTTETPWVLCGATFGSSPVGVSSDGRYVAFWSEGTNLVDDDTNDAIDMFVRDRQLDITERVSLGYSGEQLAEGLGNGSGSISADGRYVLFPSHSPELGESKTLLYLRDLVADTTTRVSVDSNESVIGSSALGSMSADATKVAFAVDDPALGINAQYVRDLNTGVTQLVATGTTSWYVPQLTADGSSTLFMSTDATLVPNDTNEYADVFVKDLNTGSIERINVSNDEAEEISAYDPETLPVNPAEPSMSSDGRFVSFTVRNSSLIADGGAGVMLRDRVAGTTEFVSVDIEHPPALTLCFASGSDVSFDGRYVSFDVVCEEGDGQSRLTDLRGTFARDRSTATTIRIDETSEGVESDGDPRYGVDSLMSADGRYVVFSSWATNLDPADTNGTRDVFINRLS